MLNDQSILWRATGISRFVLGCAQLGMNYGIANVHGQPAEQQAVEIINAAWRNGVRFFDTAQAYGTSEEVLGKAFKKLNVASETQVVTKLSPLLDPADAEGVYDSIKASCQMLGVGRLWAILLHRPEWLSVWDRGLGAALRRAQDEGLVSFFGVSTYTPEEALAALDYPCVDMIQVPCNAWDQRARSAGIFDKARSLNKLCFVRSVYLQGLLAMPADEVAKKLPPAYRAALHWHNLATRYGITPEALAIRFALSLNVPLVIGAERPEQVAGTISLIKQASFNNFEDDDLLSEMSPLLDEKVLNPCFWNAMK